MYLNEVISPGIDIPFFYFLFSAWQLSASVPLLVVISFFWSPPAHIDRASTAPFARPFLLIINISGSSSAASSFTHPCQSLLAVLSGDQCQHVRIGSETGAFHLQIIIAIRSTFFAKLFLEFLLHVLQSPHGNPAQYRSFLSAPELPVLSCVRSSSIRSFLIDF